MTKRLFLASCCLMLALSCAAQNRNTDYVREMEHALAQEDTASTFASVLNAAQALEQIAEDYPDEWLAKYWTAHVYTQVALFSGDPAADTYTAYLDTAQAYYDRAWAALPEKTPAEVSDFLVLQANLYGFRQSHHQRQQAWDQVNRFSALQHDALLEAALTNPNNPRVHMMRGIGLMRSEETREKGRAVLQEAIRKYEAHPPATTISPSWGRPWVDYWLQRFAEEGS